MNYIWFYISVWWRSAGSCQARSSPSSSTRTSVSSHSTRRTWSSQPSCATWSWRSRTQTTASQCLQESLPIFMSLNMKIKSGFQNFLNLWYILCQVLKSTSSIMRNRSQGSKEEIFRLLPFINFAIVGDLSSQNISLAIALSRHTSYS